MYTGYESGCKALLATVLKLAVLDWRKVGCGDEVSREILELEGSKLEYTRDVAVFAKDAGFISAREELLAFFLSDWCHELFDWLGVVDYRRAMSEIGIQIGR